MRKYRTKSGNIEEKLPGINATVNPSEKVQIAMAGGVDSIQGVRDVLGLQGKTNNLKGQGAKNIISFDTGAGGDDASDDADGEADASSPGEGGEAATGAGPSDDETSDEGFGFTGQQGYGVSSTDDAGLGVGWGKAPTSVESEDIGTIPTPTATEKAAATEDIGAKAGALSNAIAAQEEAEEVDWSDVFGKVKTGLTFASLVKDTLVSFYPPGLALTAIGFGLGKAMGKGGTTDATADPDTTMGPTPADPGQDDEADEPSEPAPGPDTSPDGVDFQKQRSAARVNRAASNNTTLAVSEEDDFTRQELRRARRQITRFA
jgi:hypothetical protein